MGGPNVLLLFLVLFLIFQNIGYFKPESESKSPFSFSLFVLLSLPCFPFTYQFILVLSCKWLMVSN